MFFQSVMRVLFGEKRENHEQDTIEHEFDEEELAEAIARAEELLNQGGMLSPAEELEIERTIEELRNSGFADERKMLQERYDEYYSWNYDNEDEL